MLTVSKKKRSAFAKRLRELREAAGLSQVDVAARAGVVRQTYIRWERGDTEPTFSDLCILAKVFEIELDDFRE